MVEERSFCEEIQIIVFTFFHIPEPNLEKNDNISYVPYVHAKFENKMFYFSFRRNQSK